MKKFPLLLALSSLLLFSCASLSENSSSSSSSAESTSSSTSEETVDYIILNYSVLTLEVGSTGQIEIEDPSGEVDPSLATYIAQDGTIASVNGSGLISAKSEGETKIYVFYKGASSSLLLTVTKTYPEVTNLREGNVDFTMQISQGDSSLLSASFASPLDMYYTTKNGHKNSDGAFMLAFSPNETSGEATVATNFAYLQTLFNIQNIMPGLALLMDFSSLPGQYKAIGASYRDIDILEPAYNEHFYFIETDERTSFGSYAEVNGTNMPRLHYTMDSLISPLSTIEEVLDFLANTDLSSLDYVALLNEYLSDGVISTGTITSLASALLQALIFFFTEFQITKTTVNVGSFTGVNFLFEDRGTLGEELSRIFTYVLTYFGFSLGEVDLDVNKCDFSFTVYTDNYDNTCLSDISSEFSLSLSESYSLDMNFSYEFDYVVNTVSEGYLDTYLTMDDSFAKTSTNFENFYEKISPAVSFFIGDAPSSGLDISLSNGTKLQNYANEYSSLSSATKFMLSDKVTADSITVNYMLGRTSLISSGVMLNLTSDYDGLVTALATTKNYLNWDKALQEYNSSLYEKILNLESEYLSSIVNSINEATNSLNAYDASTSISDTLSLFEGAYEVLCGSSSSLNYFANDNASILLSDLASEVEEAFSLASPLLDSLYSGSLSKFKAILDSNSISSDKLSDLYTLFVGEGTTPLLSEYLTSISGTSFTLGGNRGDFLSAIQDETTGTSYSTTLLEMDAYLIKEKRIEGYSLYGTSSWDAFVSEANTLINQVSSLESAIYGASQTDVSALATLISE